jgi:rhodanese-related sulfurtransferase
MFGVFNQIFGGGAEAVDVKALIDQGALLIDVRTPAEFNGGAAPGAKNIPLQELKHHIGKLKETGKPVVAYCRSGNRSGMAAQILNEKGIEAYNAGSVGQVRQMLGK